MTREYQRKSADDAQKRTKQYEAVELDFIGFQMFELYQIETYNLIEDRLVKLFPQLRDPFEREKLASIRGTVENSGPGSFNHVGIIAKEKLFLVSSFVCLDEELPNTIRYISIQIHKILPSVIGVVFDVKLTDVASKELSRIQAAFYLPEIEFKYLFPFSFGGRYGHKQTDGQGAKAANVLKWIDEIHYAAQKSVKSLLFGYFSKPINSKKKLLPSIEFYLIKGVPNEVLNDVKVHESWARSERGWLNSLGFSIDIFDNVYKTSQEMLSFQSYGTWERNKYLFPSPFSRLLVLQEPFVKETNLDMYSSDIRAALETHCGLHVMSDLVIYIAITEFLDITVQKIEKFKSLVFHRMGNKRWLSRHIALSSALLREQALTKAIMIEFEQVKERLEKSKGYDSALKIEVAFGSDNGKQRSFADVMTEHISYAAKRLDQQIDQINVIYLNYLSLRNMEAIYWLQFVAAFAAVLSIVAVAIQMWSSEDIRNWIKSFIY